MSSPLQYTIIEEPAKRRFYPLWRECDKQEWQYFTLLGIQLYYQSRDDAQWFLDKKPGPRGEESSLTAIATKLQDEGLLEDE